MLTRNRSHKTGKLAEINLQPRQREKYVDEANSFQLSQSRGSHPDVEVTSFYFSQDEIAKIHFVS